MKNGGKKCGKEQFVHVLAIHCRYFVMWCLSIAARGNKDCWYGRRNDI